MRNLLLTLAIALSVPALAGCSTLADPNGPCCKQCGTDTKPCGDFCIPAGQACSKTKGCACATNSGEIPIPVPRDPVCSDTDATPMQTPTTSG